MTIVPSIITSDIVDLKAKLAQVAAFSESVQIDFFDDEFVPDYRSLQPKDFQEIKTDLKLIAHILAYRPQEYLADLKAAGFYRVIFHYETTDAPKEVINLARESYISVGLAINPDTVIDEILPLADTVEEILFLAVDPKHPGVYKSSVIDKIKNWNTLNPSPALVSVDGGLSADNVDMVSRAGVQIAYIGGAIFNRGNPDDNFRRINSRL